MEKKSRKGIVKKIFVIVCVLTILQSYFMSFAYVVKAMDMTFSGEVENANNEVTEETPIVDDTLQEEIDESNETNSEDSNSEEVLNDVENEENVNEEQMDDNQDNEDSSQELEDSEEQLDEELNDKDENLNEQLDEEDFGENENSNDTSVEDNKEEQDEVVEEYIEPSINVEVTSENTSIYKGYLYANATSDLRYETLYTTIDKLTFVGAKNITSASVQDEPDKIALITNTKLGLLNDMYYKQTRILVEEFNKILGENGKIAIYDANNTLIGEITKDIKIENGYYVFTYPSQMNSIKFEFVNLIGDGQISIINDKAIKESTVYSRNQISLFSAINTIANVQMNVGEEVQNIQAEGNINLEETESKMIFDIDNDVLSLENENEVTINVTMKTDEERYDLFENPSIEIEFPSVVEKVDITAINLLYRNGLSIENWNVYENSFGKQVLKINLSGSQLEYTPGTVQEGTTVVIYAKINNNRLTANTTENLKMTYTNKDTIRKSYMLEGKDAEEITVSFVGKQELLHATGAMNLTTLAESTSYDDKIETIQIQAEGAKQTVTLTGTAINNFETTVENAYIIGRFPCIGNKDENGNELTSNFNAELSSTILTNGLVADIYYSENIEAKFDDESWTQDTTDLGKYKSYKIVIRNGNMAKGEKIQFEYNVDIPENVGYNAKSYSIYTVYYTLESQEYSDKSIVGLVSEEREITDEDLNEEEKEDVSKTLTIGIQASQGGNVLEDGDTIYERQIVRYSIVVTNISHSTITNLKLKANATNSNLYYLKTWISNDRYDGNYLTGQYEEDVNSEKMYEEFSLDGLRPGETKTYTYEAITKENVTEVYPVVLVSADEIEETSVEGIKIPVKEALVEVRNGYAPTEDLSQNDAFTTGGLELYSYVKNISDRDLENVKLSIVIPKELYYNELFLINGADGLQRTIESNIEGQILTFTIPKLKVGEERTIYVYTRIEEMNLNIASTYMTVKSYAVVEDIKYLSNDYKKLIKQGKTKIEHSWTTDNTNEIVEHEDVLSYTFTMTNTGLCSAGKLRIYNKIPAGTEIFEYSLIKSDGEICNLIQNDINEIIGYTVLDINESVTFKLKYKVNKLLFEPNQSRIENQVEVSGGIIDEFKTDVISFDIKNENSNVDENDNPSIDEPSEDENDNQNNNDNSQETTDTPNLDDNENNPNDGNNNDNLNNDIDNNVDEELDDIVRNYYNISGRVWLDKDKDGINNNENGMEAIVAILYKANSQGGADISNQVATTVTNSSGNYKFENLESGNYVVAFNYDTSLYNLTKYQVKTAKSNENSDVISKKIGSGESAVIYGMTDVLVITNQNLDNIDMGVITKNDFDLELDKYISKVTVKNSDGIKTYNYENDEEVKLEISSKKYKSTTLDITYKIIISNTGEIDGIVNKIVDYIPEDTKIDLNNNPGWYYGDDGNLYYNGLIGKEIKPGDKEEVTLILRKSLANGEAIRIVNSAEIVEYTNSYGLQDKDSVAKNKEDREDDFGKVELIVTISTGAMKENILIIFIIIVTISFIIFVKIKKISFKKMYR